MKHGQTLRRLYAPDANAFRGARLLGLQLHPECFGSSYYEEAERPLDWFEAKLSDNIVIGAHTQSLELSGIIAVEQMQSAKQRHKGVVWGVFIRPQYRGCGLGDMLTNMLFAQCKGVIEELRLTVAETNEAARRLYLKAGFSDYGFEKRSLKIDNCYVAEHHMMRQL
ncbi:Putative GCN5-related N-acetyltransferase [Neorhizobium galegae bv. orientalis]|nr:Putative GCN5-related N-acetyltransferase [Neorhizobium galegae bv. orientalis]